MRAVWDWITYIIGGLIAATEDDDPELWDNPRKKARIRRRMERREGR